MRFMHMVSEDRSYYGGFYSAAAAAAATAAGARAAAALPVLWSSCRDEGGIYREVDEVVVRLGRDEMY